jgi:hypothetical protein
MTEKKLEKIEKSDQQGIDGWEYATRITSFNSEGSWLPQMGAEGWELVQVQDWGQNLSKYYLKRRKTFYLGDIQLLTESNG